MKPEDHIVILDGLQPICGAHLNSMLLAYLREAVMNWGLEAVLERVRARQLILNPDKNAGIMGRWKDQARN